MDVLPLLSRSIIFSVYLFLFFFIVDNTDINFSDSLPVNFFNHPIELALA